MQQLVLVIHVLAAIAIIGLVLMQHGKGADAGAAFGSGSSNTMFGSQGSVPFLMKITALLAAIFISTSLILANMASSQQKASNAFNIPKTAPISVPVKTMPAKKLSAKTNNAVKKPVQSNSSKKP